MFLLLVIQLLLLSVCHGWATWEIVHFRSQLWLEQAPKAVSLFSYDALPPTKEAQDTLTSDCEWEACETSMAMF